MERYQPTTPGQFNKVEDLGSFVMQELERLAAVLALTLPSELEELHAEPEKLREGMIVFADGTNWNPGAGRGAYIYYSAAWHKLG